MVASPAQVARLAAGAAAGTAGVQAYEEAKAGTQAASNAAITGLQGTAARLGAPSALTAQLSHQIAAPGQTEMGNDTSLGRVAGAAAQSEQGALGNYLTEASAAEPLIKSEADRDLGQKIALLNASKSGGGRGGGAASLSDAELRNRLLGLATSIRQGQIGDLQKSLLVQAQGNQAIRHQLAVNASGPGEKITGRGSFFDESNYQPNAGDPVDPYEKALANLAQQKITVSQKTNDLYGPGLVNEATQLGLQAGISPDRVYGLLTPQDDAAYVAANKKLGLYTDPNQQDVTGQTLPLQDAAKLAGIPLSQASALADKTHYVWSDPNSLANKGLKSFLSAGAKPDPANPNLYTAADGNTYDLTKPEDLTRAQQAFMANPTSKQFATNVRQDVVDDAHRAVLAGLDFNTWIRNLQNTDEYKYDPKSFVLGFAQAQPLFQYAAALHSRQATVPDTSTYAPAAG